SPTALGPADPWWDTNGTTAGAGSTTAGLSKNWSTTSGAFWNSSSDGTGAVSNWVNGDVAVFSAGTDATVAFTVTIGAGENISANSITIEEGSPTISATTGSAATLSIGAGGMTVNS